jgi:hypothetical protein
MPRFVPVDDDPFAGGQNVTNLVTQTFGENAPTALAVMKAESSNNPSAVNSKNRNGTVDRGLFQINDVNVPKLIRAGIISNANDLLDPETNIRAAKFLHEEKGWQPWNSSKSRWEGQTNPAPAPQFIPVDNDPFQEQVTSAALQTTAPESAKPKPPSVLDNYPMSDMDKFRTGIGSGLVETWKGLQQLSYKLPPWLGGTAEKWFMSDNEIQQKQAQLARETDARRALMAPLKQDSPWIVGGGEVLGQAAPAAIIPGGVSGGLLARAATSGLAGAGLGAAQPTGVNDSTALNMALGGGMGAAAPVVLAPVSKLFNAIFKKVPPSVVEDQSKQFGIRTTLGETTGNPLIKKAETWLEELPIIGLKRFRQKQQQEAESAVKDFFTKYVVDPAQGTTAGMKAANDVQINAMYDAVKSQAANLPKVEAPSVKTATSELLDRFSEVFNSIQDNKIKRILNDIAGDVKDKTVNTGIVNSSGNPITRQVTPKFSFDDLWQLRKGIGKEIGDARTDTARGQLRKLYAAVSDDIDTSLAQGGSDALQAFKGANEAFKQYSVKFDVLRDAFDKAAGTTGAGEMFSPKRFSTILKNLANDPNYKKNVKWSPGEVEEMTGLANILQVTKRAGQFAENPPTGLRWGMPTILGSLGIGGAATGGVPGIVATGAGVVGTASVAKFLTTTTMGKNFARAASKIEPGDIRMKMIVDRIYRSMATTPYLATRAASGE